MEKINNVRKITIYKNFCVLITIVLIFLMNFFCNFVQAESSAGNSDRVKLEFSYDTKEAGKVKITAKIKTDGTVKYAYPLAIHGILDYDKNLIETPTISGSSMANGGDVLADYGSFTEGQDAFTIELTAKSVTSETKTSVNIKDFSIAFCNASDGQDAAIEKDLLKIGDFKVNSLGVFVDDGSSESNNAKSNTFNNEEDNKNNKTDSNKTNSNEISDNKTNSTENNNSDTNFNKVIENMISDNKIISKQNDTNSSIVSQSNTYNGNATNVYKSEYINPVKKDTTTSNKIIPQTGEKITISVVIGIVIFIGIITFIRYRKFYD